MAIFQVDNVKVHKDQTMKVERSMKNHLYMWIDSSESRAETHSVFGMCWRRLYRMLDSCIGITSSYPIIDAHLDGNKCDVIFIKRFIALSSWKITCWRSHKDSSTDFRGKLYSKKFQYRKKICINQTISLGLWAKIPHILAKAAPLESFGGVSSQKSSHWIHCQLWLLWA